MVPQTVATAMPLPDAISDLFGLGDLGLIGQAITAFVAAFLIANVLLVMAAFAGPWGKRKIFADFSDRYAITEHGPWGLFIIPAAAIQLMSKELIVPKGVDRPAWDIAPIIMVFSAIFGFAVIPMGSGIHLADPEVGLLFAFAIASLSTLGMMIAGYASDNKFALMGGLRATAQNIAYEIPLIVTGASVILYTGSLQMSEIVAVQAETLVQLGPISIPAWFAFVNPFAFVLFLAAGMAEVGRNPFDVPEAPTEIVAGYQTEYSSIYFVLVYLSEFLHIFLAGAIMATLFLGGPAGPGPAALGIVWFLAKVVAFFLLTQWFRTAMPRVRIDQLIEIGWKGLLVLSFANLLLTAGIVGVFFA
ncbi:NAD(P)H-quinone oxidoreductase subunit 1 [Halovivax asiaticus JCM 14624]|uniref:NAD(P)H-quinone oxidoreductase subunit 1 n=1 Tax=Halovivax asiaticus JCM 14624 TaxID=1227490 RepID=M0BRB4_9EURY|nr:complex I subunit 1 family protein [Halovivax asiaticus]ELZ12657.1 NAD(P)H-quinone oxidoreductase subunit 1 [Halovivax asiaticus JCM 14624]